MQAVFTLGWASYVLKKFIMDNSLFSPEWRDAVFDEGDLLLVYIYRKGTREDLYYFNEELPSEDDDSNQEIENNKADKENKENIPDNKPSKVLVNNKAV